MYQESRWQDGPPCPNDGYHPPPSPHGNTPTSRENQQTTIAHSPQSWDMGTTHISQPLSTWGSPGLWSPGPPFGVVFTTPPWACQAGNPYLPPITRPLTWESPVDFRTLMWAVSGGCAGVPATWYPFTAGEKHCSDTTPATHGRRQLPATVVPSPTSLPASL